MFIYLLALSLPVSAGALLFARREYRRHGKLTPAGLLAVCLMLLVPNLMLDSVIGYAWPSTGLDWLGLALGTLGLALCLAGITAFHSPSKVLCLDAGRLTLSGPYRWSRNPQYVGCFLLLLGFALNDWSWWCLVALLVLAIDLHLLVLVEEEHLRRVFGEAYREFCRRVPRYAGWRTASSERPIRRSLLTGAVPQVLPAERTGCRGLARAPTPLERDPQHAGKTGGQQPCLICSRKSARLNRRCTTVSQQRTPESCLAAAVRLLAVALAAVALSATAGQAETIRQYQFAPADGAYQLVQREVARPSAGAGEVLVRVRAVSLNRRDLNMLANDYGGADAYSGGIPLSDGAGEVIAVGEGVTRFAVGDRVAGIFFERWIEGPPSPDALASDRGGNPGGMLSEVIVSHQDGLVRIPPHLSYEEAATLPCAALTAWVGLFKRGRLQPGQFVLLEGTGGVSVFGLLLSAAAGAKPIITSSHDAKLERAKTLGAFGTANYRANPEWQNEVRELTGGHGVDQVLDVGGRDTLPRALEALAHGGHIALIGGLSGYGADLPTDSLMWINATASGVYVGSREDFEAMNAFISEHEIRPLIDRVYDFEQAPAAFDAMRDGDFMGKIVIRIGDGRTGD